MEKEDNFEVIFEDIINRNVIDKIDISSIEGELNSKKILTIIDSLIIILENLMNEEKEKLNDISQSKLYNDYHMTLVTTYINQKVRLNKFKKIVDFNNLLVEELYEIAKIFIEIITTVFDEEKNKVYVSDSDFLFIEKFLDFTKSNEKEINKKNLFNLMKSVMIKDEKKYLLLLQGKFLMDRVILLKKLDEMDWDFEKDNYSKNFRK